MRLSAKPGVFNATTEAHIDEAFAAICSNGFGALFVSSDPLFFNHATKLSSRWRRAIALPAIYAYREQVEAGGLIGYGASRSDAYRKAGEYVGRVLKGEKPGTLPVALPTKYRTILINSKTAKALGLTLPTSLLAPADEVIE